MNARQRVLQAYNNCCAICGRTDTLEIDHIQGGGNAHRRSLGHTKLHIHLDRLHQETGTWPDGYQLLCTTPDHTGCHDLKSGRKKRMPAKKGYTNHNISLPDDLSRELTHRAEAAPYDGSKSALVHAALVAFLGGELTTTASAHLEALLEAHHRAVLGVLHEMATTKHPPADLRRLGEVAESQKILVTTVNELLGMVHRLSQQRSAPPPKTGISKWISK